MQQRAPLQGACAHWLKLTRHVQAGVQIKRQGQRDRFALSITDSLEELRHLAQTAGLHVVGQTFQALESPHPVRPAHALARFLTLMVSAKWFCSKRTAPKTVLRSLQRTYLGTGKLAELATELGELKPDTVIFDDELTPGQLRNLEKVWDHSLPSPCSGPARRRTVQDLKARSLQASLCTHPADAIEASQSQCF